MTNLDMQNLNRATMNHLVRNIKVGMSLKEVRELCETYMLENGADSFWYWDIGAFVFSGNETAVSVSGRQYKTSDRIIEENDIITVDLSPQNNNIWGDYARTIIIQNGITVERTEDVENAEWRSGLETEIFLHKKLAEIAEPDMTFEELYYKINSIISDKGFINLDFMGNLGHSIVNDKNNRIYIEKGNKNKLSDAEFFTFEPHISIQGSEFGYKREDIYYFENGKLFRL